MCLLTKCLSDNIVYFISFYPLPLTFYYMCLTKYKYLYDNSLNNMIFGGDFLGNGKVVKIILLNIIKTNFIIT